MNQPFNEVFEKKVFERINTDISADMLSVTVEISPSVQLPSPAFEKSSSARPVVVEIAAQAQAKSAAAYSALSSMRQLPSQEHSQVKRFCSGLSRSGFLLMEIVLSIGLLAILTVYISGHAGQVGIEADRQKNDMHAVITGNSMLEIMIATSSPPKLVLDHLFNLDTGGKTLEIPPSSPLWSGGTTTSTVQLLMDDENPDNPSSFTVLIKNSNSGTQASYRHIFVPAGALIDPAGGGGGGGTSPGNPLITDLAVGKEHTLALKYDGSVVAWGRNAWGVLGSSDDSGHIAHTPEYVRAPLNEQNANDRLIGMTKVYANLNHVSFALNSQGEIYGWGQSESHLLGEGVPLNSVQYKPIALKKLDGSKFSGFTKLSVGRNFALGLHTDGRLYAWGEGQNGQLGHNGPADSGEPLPVLTHHGNNFAGGGAHSLALAPDKKVYAWGSNSSKQLGLDSSQMLPTEIPDLPPAKMIEAVACGQAFSLALTGDGRVYAWGANNLSQCAKSNPGGNVPNTVNKPSIVNVRTGPGNSDNQDVTDIVAICAGASHTIALQKAGDGLWLYTWGNNASGQLGWLRTSMPLVFEARRFQLPAIRNLNPQSVKVRTGDSHSVIVFGSTGRVLAAGAHESGQLGPWLSGNFVELFQNAGSSFDNVVDAALGASFSLFLQRDGTIRSCGLNNRGQLGNSNVTAENSKYFMDLVTVYGNDNQPLKRVNAIAAGENWAMAIASGSVIWAWGDNQFGQLGNAGPAGFSRVPIKVYEGQTDEEKPVFIKAGRYHGLALLRNGRMIGWGDNRWNQLGPTTAPDGSSINWKIPREITGLSGMVGYLTGVTDIAAGKAHSLARTSDGYVWAWGGSPQEEIGAEYLLQYCPVPQKVRQTSSTALSNIQRVAATTANSYAVDTTGRVWAWGSGTKGERGNGTTGAASQGGYPTLVYAESGQSGSTLLDVRLISGGYEQVLAQKGDADKTLVGWGNNDSRQLGDGAGFTLSTRITYPTPINGAKGFSHFGTGEAHSVGISDGLIYTWGSDNLMGLLGDGTDNNLKTIPTLIQVP